jgi:archaemetzincin
LRCRISQDGRHVQLQVNGVLTKLKQVIPDDALCLVALTMTDLYDETPDLFVAGMAAGQDRVAVFSFCRYDPAVSFSSEFWYDLAYRNDIAQSERQKLMLQRSCRLLVHELAHLLGVDHCIYYSCCMNGSGHLNEDFRQPMHLCPVDLRKLAHLCGYDITQRYRNLLQFYQENGLSEEADWVVRRLDFIAK